VPHFKSTKVTELTVLKYMVLSSGKQHHRLFGKSFISAAEDSNKG
jgi:hypothetical protein